MTMCDSYRCPREPVFTGVPCVYCGVVLMDVCVECFRKSENECEPCHEYSKESHIVPTAAEMRAEEQYDGWRGK